MNSFNSTMLSLKGGKARGSVEIYFKNNEIDALDSIIVYNGKNPVFSTTFRK